MQLTDQGVLEGPLAVPGSTEISGASQLVLNRCWHGQMALVFTYCSLFLFELTFFFLFDPFHEMLAKL